MSDSKSDIGGQELGVAADAAGLSPSVEPLRVSPADAASIPNACANCKGSGWVCENHPDRPWGHLSAPGEGCDCGAGSPCPVCNLTMAAAGLTEPLRKLIERSIAMLESAERETSWGDPLFGPSPSEEIKAALDAILANSSGSTPQ